MKMRFPYFYQLVLGFLTVIITLMVIMTFSLFHFGRDQLLNNIEESFMRYADLIEDVEDEPEKLDVYHQFLENQQIEYGIFNPNGDLQYPSTEQDVQIDLSQEDENTLAEGNAILLQTTSNDLRGNNEETVLIYTPVENENGTYEGFIGVGHSLSQLEGYMDELRWNVFRAFIVAAIVAVILSILISYFLVKRVNRLSEAAQQVATGDYDIYIDHSNRDEIDRLSADFNKMIKSLSEWRKEVLHLEDRRKTFMQDVAHEMRTPLTTINGLLEGLEYGVFDEKQELRSIQLMGKETKRLIRLVNENLDYENIESNRIVLNRDHIPVIEAMEEIKQQLQRIAEDSNNEIIIADNIDDVTVYADFDRFKQIMVNLLKNAIQFTEDGEITVNASQTDEITEVTVSDTGIGMTEEQMENIWERYYKADSSRKNTKYGESGLGLSIVKKLVELHEGHIKAESQPGEGSTFTMIFPRPQPVEDDE